MLYKVEWQQYEDVQEWESKGFNELMEAIKFYYEKQEDNYYVQLTQRLMENFNEKIIKDETVEYDTSHLPYNFNVKCIKEVSHFFSKGLVYGVKNFDGEFRARDNHADIEDNYHIIRTADDDGTWFEEHFQTL